MNKQDEYAEVKQTLTQIHRRLETEPLTDEQRDQLQNHAAALAGNLLRPWLPVDWARRLLILGIVALGIEESVRGNYEPLLWWLLLPMFSPRLMGELAYYAGKLTGTTRRQD